MHCIDNKETIFVIYSFSSSTHFWMYRNFFFQTFKLKIQNCLLFEFVINLSRTKKKILCINKIQKTSSVNSTQKTNKTKHQIIINFYSNGTRYSLLLVMNGVIMLDSLPFKMNCLHLSKKKKVSKYFKHITLVHKYGIFTHN